MNHGLIDIATLAKVQDLELIAKKTILGSSLGLHSSKQRGAGFEFSQYRAYQPGDDLRFVDWKLLARSERVFVRESERESQHEIWFVCDLTSSMQQPSGQIDNWTKLSYAKSLIASLAHIVCYQGDRFGFFGLSDSVRSDLPQGSGKDHLQKLFRTLEKAETGDSWTGPDATPLVWRYLQSAELIVFVTDFFQLRQEMSSFTSKLAAAGKELIVLQLLTQDEKEFPYQGNIAFEDRETGQLLETNARDARDHYLKSSKDELASNSRHIRGLGGQFEVLHIEEALDTSVNRILMTRRDMTMGRGRR